MEDDDDREVSSGESSDEAASTGANYNKTSTDGPSARKSDNVVRRTEHREDSEELEIDNGDDDYDDSENDNAGPCASSDSAAAAATTTTTKTTAAGAGAGEDEEQENEENTTFEQSAPVFAGSRKKHTPGIIYLSYIPEGLTVAQTREILGVFGNVGRIYFEPVKRLNKRTQPRHRFIEGWVEFEKKKVAKKVAELLNAKPVGGKRRAPYYDALWSMKYLHRFRWTHLSERLAYEKAVKDQRLRTEVAQAKREASYYAKALERSIRMRKRVRKAAAADDDDDDKEDPDHHVEGNNRPVEQGLPRPGNVRLKKTDREIRREKQEGSQVDRELLQSIFAK